jgi:hypothetical protein
MNKLDKYGVWLAEYKATGEFNDKKFLGFFDAETWEDACELASISIGIEEHHKYYNREQNTYFGVEFWVDSTTPILKRRELTESENQCGLPKLWYHNVPVVRHITLGKIRTSLKDAL